MFPTHVCAMGHCTAPDISTEYEATPAELLLTCRAMVYKQSGMFSHHCEAKLSRLTKEQEAAYRLGGEWAVQDLLGILPLSVARRWV